MRIERWRTTTREAQREIVARVAGWEVFIRCPLEFDPVPLADPFVVAALGKAMETGGELLEVDPTLPLSASLRTSLLEWQHINCTWWPELRPVRLSAGDTAVTPRRSGRVACFFSGGVDSFYLAYRNRASITDLVLCRGYDIAFPEVARWERTVDGARRVAESLGVRLTLIETNLKAELLVWVPDNHAAVLVASVLGLGFDTVLLPASDSPVNLTQWGSHPLTDPLFSTDVTRVLHDGMDLRTAKTRYLIESGVPLDDLRVCNRVASYNCGACEKCLRTMVALDLFGGRSSALPAFRPPMLDHIRLTGQNHRFWRENLQAARAVGRADVARAVTRLLDRLDRTEWLRTADRLYLGGRARRALRRLRGTP